MARRLLSRDAACRYLSVGLSTLWRLEKDGTIPALRVGRKVLFDVGDLERFVARQRRVGLRGSLRRTAARSAAAQRERPGVEEVRIRGVPRDSPRAETPGTDVGPAEGAASPAAPAEDRTVDAEASAVERGPEEGSREDLVPRRDAPADDAAVTVAAAGAPSTGAAPSRDASAGAPSSGLAEAQSPTGAPSA